LIERRPKEEDGEIIASGALQELNWKDQQAGRSEKQKG